MFKVLLLFTPSKVCGVLLSPFVLVCEVVGVCVSDVPVCVCVHIQACVYLLSIYISLLPCSSGLVSNCCVNYLKTNCAICSGQVHSEDLTVSFYVLIML